MESSIAVVNDNIFINLYVYRFVYVVSN